MHDSDFYSVSFTNSLGLFQLAVFVASCLIVLGAIITFFRRRDLRARVSVFLGFFGIGLFFYAATLETLTLVHVHETNMMSGGGDPAALDRAYMMFYTKLHAFRSLATLTMIIAAVGAIIGINLANKPSHSSPDRSESK